MLTILLDDNRAGGGALLFKAPLRIVRADLPEEVEPALTALADAQRGGLHAAGFLSYELGLLMEPKLQPLLPPSRGIPLILFGIFEAPRRLTKDEVEDWLAARGNCYAIRNIRPNLEETAYRQKFERTKAYIAAGDIYQLNLTFKARFDFEGSSAALYRDLRSKQHVQYGAFIEADGFTLLSLSPELFIERRGNTLLTRPMKGTAPRGLTWREDREIAAELAADIKSRAENLMIVDLMRNDVGRIAEPGSVRVTDLFTVESFDTVLQMTSGVEARLPETVDFRDLVHALFPPGSITGAPKVRAIEIIAELEDEPRGIYTGAIGCLEPGGDLRFNVAIRTLKIGAGGEGEIGIGSGVVQDSRAKAEYDECLLKMNFLTAPVINFDLIETLRWDEGRGFMLLERHLNRMEASAARFGFAFDRDAVQGALIEHVREPGAPSLRVRCLLSRDGEITVTSQPLTANAGAPMRFVLSGTRLDPGSVWLYHKTTNRAFYDEERVRLAGQTGCDEVVFVNVRGELTEGSFTNLFIERDGEMLTPPVSSGLLAGTLRQEMLETGRAREYVLTPDDLLAAEAIWLGNSVRGLVRAEYVGGLTAAAGRSENALSR